MPQSMFLPETPIRRMHWTFGHAMTETDKPDIIPIDTHLCYSQGCIFLQVLL